MQFILMQIRRLRRALWEIVVASSSGVTEIHIHTRYCPSSQMYMHACAEAKILFLTSSLQCNWGSD